MPSNDGVAMPLIGILEKYARANRVTVAAFKVVTLKSPILGNSFRHLISIINTVFLNIRLVLSYFLTKNEQLETINPLFLKTNPDSSL
jgi:hypothetical protein